MEFVESAQGLRGPRRSSQKTRPLRLIFGFPEEILKKYDLKDNYCDPNDEGRLISAEFRDVWVVNVYTPNAKSDLSRLALRHERWHPAFLAFCKRLEKKKPVIACGDFNVAHTSDDLANPEANEGEHGFTREERAGIDTFIEAGFVDAFRIGTKGKCHYTWWSHFANARARNVGWRIDYFFVSKTLVPKVISVKIHQDVMGSDHCPVSLELNLWPR